ncbi:MAG: D-2-hydroxyacid dehydrogenase [Isosphaeraceae bacterium]
MKFVIYPAVGSDRLAALEAAAPGIELVNAVDQTAAARAVQGAPGFLGKITPRVLAEADQLQWVQAFTVSLEHYMFPELVTHPCVVTNMRGLFSDVIADQVMGYILCFARNLHTYIRRQVEHRYEPLGGESARVDNAFGPGTVNAMDRATIYLPESTLGIFGMGSIGSEIARRALGFGMTVRGVDRFPERITPPVGMSGVEGLDRFPELLGWSDFVVIAAPHTPETKGLFDAGVLAFMRSTSYLINIGRGAIVVLDDLVAALKAGRLSGAALDVFEVEPLPAAHPLWELPNVIITPHTSGYSRVIAERHLAVLVENVRRFAAGEPLKNVVDKALWF